MKTDALNKMSISKDISQWRGKFRLAPASDLWAPERLSSCNGNATGWQSTQDFPRSTSFADGYSQGRSMGPVEAFPSI